MAKRVKHLYRKGGKAREEPKFERRYGKEKGKRVYGATVGKVKREREAKRRGRRPRARRPRRSRRRDHLSRRRHVRRRRR